MHAPLPELLSMRKAARLLGVSAGRTLKPLIDCGAIRTVRVGNRDRIPRSEIERIAREGATEKPMPRMKVVRRAAPQKVTAREMNERLKAAGY